MDKKWTLLLTLFVCFACEGEAPKLSHSTRNLTSSNAAYIFDFGSGINDTGGPGIGSSIFVNAVTGSPIGAGNTGSYNGVSFTNVPVSAIDANPAHALDGFDTAVLYMVCDIASHPATLGALSHFVDSGHKLMIFDADACAPTEDFGRGPADYSGFLFPFATNSPGPQGASGLYTEIEASTLTTGLSLGFQAGDSVGDANVFTSNAGGWCESIKARNINGFTGFVEAYARTVSGGLAIYEGEDFWFTFGPTSHLQQVFDLILAQQYDPDGLPCTIPASGIKLDPPTQTHNVGDTATLTATVVDTNGTPISGTSVTLQVLSGPDAGLTLTATTNGSGQAAFSYSDTLASGTDTVQASFTDGGGTHSSNKALDIWQAEPTVLVTGGDTTQDFDDVATVSARLTAGLLPVPGKTVTIALGGQSCSGVTDATGTATCSILIAQAAGTYALTASFAGSDPFLPSTASSTFVVTLEETTIAYTGDTLIANGGTAHLSGRLLEDGIKPIPAVPITLTLGAQSCTATTNALGVGACAISPVVQPLGPGTAGAHFAGNAFYQPANATTSVLIFANLDSGAFVIGEGHQAVGNRVEFWGAQWRQNNLASAPASFKGFAATTTTPPACGSGWSTRPGNSSNPPDTIPSFLAVIVADSVTQGGSTISGDTTHIVVVQTDPGYQPDPGHPGTGTVVATVCNR